MIDLHNHILPGLDDGAADLDESVEIARQFASEGVQAVVATPHFNPLNDSPADAATVRRLVDDVQGAIDRAGVDLAVAPGNELYLTPDAEDLLKAGKVSGLAGGRAVLVEVSMSGVERPLYLDATLFQLQLAGYLPILAHPERYPFVQRDVSSVDALVGRGVSLQLTAPSLLGDYGRQVKRTAEKLLERGSYSLAASDRHHPGRARSLADLRVKLIEMAGEDLAQLLLTANPARVIKGREAMQADPLPARTGSIFSRLKPGRSRADW